MNREQDKAIERQKQDIEDQNQEIRRLQTQIAVYQIRHSVNFRNGTMKVYAGERWQETNKKEYNKIYYSLIWNKDAKIIDDSLLALSTYRRLKNTDMWRHVSSKIAKKAVQEIIYRFFCWKNTAGKVIRSVLLF